MPKFYSIEPENSGDWGGKTRVVNYEEIKAGRAYQRKLENVEIIFDWMPEDDLITCGDCYLVSDRLEQALQDADISGVRFESVKISKSDIFRGYYPRRRLPHSFKLMVPTGEMRFSNVHGPTFWSGNDVCLGFYPDLELTQPGPIDVKHWLVVSEKCYRVLQTLHFEEWQRLEQVNYFDRSDLS
jgi:hypothetical protein